MPEISTNPPELLTGDPKLDNLIGDLTLTTENLRGDSTLTRDNQKVVMTMKQDTSGSKTLG